jgi:hypothetical protein
MLLLIEKDARIEEKRIKSKARFRKKRTKGGESEKNDKEEMTRESKDVTAKG